jgi:5-methylcytosine-specific restriction endonuclease McrA
MSSTVEKEKAKAREIRKSRWWQNRIANAQCYYCQKRLKAREVTMDHVVPLAQGGKSTPGNIVPCCKECNNAKKDLSAAEILLNQLEKTEKGD